MFIQIVQNTRIFPLGPVRAPSGPRPGPDRDPIGTRACNNWMAMEKSCETTKHKLARNQNKRCTMRSCSYKFGRFSPKDMSSTAISSEGSNKLSKRRFIPFCKIWQTYIPLKIKNGSPRKNMKSQLPTFSTLAPALQC